MVVSDDDDVPTYTPRTMRLIGEDMKILADENDRLRAAAETFVTADEAVALWREEQEKRTDARCVHCDSIVPKDSLDHWRTCAKHPAWRENATLRAQLAEAVALLERSPMLYRCIAGSMGQDFCDSRDGAICSDHARRVFLEKLKGTP